MTKVHAIPLPGNSRLNRYLGRDDFIDCYAVSSSLPPREAAEIIVAFPAWARFLLLIRRIVTAPFGLSNDGPEAPDKLGPFPVEIETADEVVAGFDDRHLNFRVSVYSTGDQVSLATWVHPHNIGGRIYLRTILPFHIAIARNALTRVARVG